MVSSFASATYNGLLHPACPVGKMGIITVHTQFQGLNEVIGCLASDTKETLAIVFLYF